MGRELDIIRTTIRMETPSWSDILLAETDLKFWSRKEFLDLACLVKVFNLCLAFRIVLVNVDK